MTNYYKGLYIIYSGD